MRADSARRMRLISSVFLGFSLILAVSCGRGSQETAVPDLLHSVPSRSVAVAVLPHGASDLEVLLDSAHVLRRLEYGALSGADMVLSFTYNGALVPLLSIDAGRAVRDTSGRLRALLARAEETGLKASLRDGYLPDGHRAVLLLSPSSAAISEAESHILSHASVLDVPGFREAVQQIAASDPSVVLRCSEASRWLPASLPGDRRFRRLLSRFAAGLCPWAVIRFEGSGRQRIIPSGGTEAQYFARVLDAQAEEKSRLGALLPENAQFVVDLPLKSWEDYYMLRREWLDAHSLLQRHDSACRSLQRRFGQKPGRWAADTGIRELARVDWDGRSVLLVWPEKAIPEENLHDFPTPGFAGEIFGSIFALGDETCAAPCSGCLVCGSREDVAAFLEAPRISDPSSVWPGRCRFAVALSGKLILGKKDGIECRTY